MESGEIWATLNIGVLRADEGEARRVWSSTEMQGWGKLGITEKTSPTNGFIRHYSHMQKSRVQPHQELNPVHLGGSRGQPETLYQQENMRPLVAYIIGSWMTTLSHCFLGLPVHRISCPSNTCCPWSDDDWLAIGHLTTTIDGYRIVRVQGQLLTRGIFLMYQTQLPLTTHLPWYTSAFLKAPARQSVAKPSEVGRTLPSVRGHLAERKGSSPTPLAPGRCHRATSRFPLQPRHVLSKSFQFFSDHQWLPPSTTKYFYHFPPEAPEDFKHQQLPEVLQHQKPAQQHSTLPLLTLLDQQPPLLAGTPPSGAGQPPQVVSLTGAPRVLAGIFLPGTGSSTVAGPHLDSSRMTTHTTFCSTFVHQGKGTVLEGMRKRRSSLLLSECAPITHPHFVEIPHRNGLRPPVTWRVSPVLSAPQFYFPSITRLGDETDPAVRALVTGRDTSLGIVNSFCGSSAAAAWSQRYLPSPTAPQQLALPSLMRAAYTNIPNTTMAHPIMLHQPKETTPSCLQEVIPWRDIDATWFPDLPFSLLCSVKARGRNKPSMLFYECTENPFNPSGQFLHSLITPQKMAERQRPYTEHLRVVLPPRSLEAGITVHVTPPTPAQRAPVVEPDIKLCTAEPFNTRHWAQREVKKAEFSIAKQVCAATGSSSSRSTHWETDFSCLELCWDHQHLTDHYRSCTTNETQKTTQILQHLCCSAEIEHAEPWPTSGPKALTLEATREQSYPVPTMNQGSTLHARWRELNADLEIAPMAELMPPSYVKTGKPQPHAVPDAKPDVEVVREAFKHSLRHPLKRGKGKEEARPSKGRVEPPAVTPPLPPTTPALPKCWFCLDWHFNRDCPTKGEGYVHATATHKRKVLSPDTPHIDVKVKWQIYTAMLDTATTGNFIQGDLLTPHQRAHLTLTHRRGNKADDLGPPQNHPGRVPGSPTHLGKDGLGATLTATAAVHSILWAMLHRYWRKRGRDNQLGGTDPPSTATSESALAAPMSTVETEDQKLNPKGLTATARTQTAENPNQPRTQNPAHSTRGREGGGAAAPRERRTLKDTPLSLVRYAASRSLPSTPSGYAQRRGTPGLRLTMEKLTEEGEIQSPLLLLQETNAQDEPSCDCVLDGNMMQQVEPEPRTEESAPAGSNAEPLHPTEPTHKLSAPPFKYHLHHCDTLQHAALCKCALYMRLCPIYELTELKGKARCFNLSSSPSGVIRNEQRSSTSDNIPLRLKATLPPLPAPRRIGDDEIFPAKAILPLRDVEYGTTLGSLQDGLTPQTVKTAASLSSLQTVLSQLHLLTVRTAASRSNVILLHAPRNPLPKSTSVTPRGNKPSCLRLPPLDEFPEPMYSRKDGLQSRHWRKECRTLARVKIAEAPVSDPQEVESRSQSSEATPRLISPFNPLEHESHFDKHLGTCWPGYPAGEYIAPVEQSPPIACATPEDTVPSHALRLLRTQCLVMPLRLLRTQCLVMPLRRSPQVTCGTNPFGFCPHTLTHSSHAHHSSQIIHLHPHDRVIASPRHIPGTAGILLIGNSDSEEGRTPGRESTSICLTLGFDSLRPDGTLSPSGHLRHLTLPQPTRPRMLAIYATPSAVSCERHIFSVSLKGVDTHPEPLLLPPHHTTPQEAKAISVPPAKQPIWATPRAAHPIVQYLRQGLPLILVVKPVDNAGPPQSATDSGLDACLHLQSQPLAGVNQQMPPHCGAVYFGILVLSKTLQQTTYTVFIMSTVLNYGLNMTCRVTHSKIMLSESESDSDVLFESRKCKMNGDARNGHKVRNGFAKIGRRIKTVTYKSSFLTTNHLYEENECANAAVQVVDKVMPAVFLEITVFPVIGPMMQVISGGVCSLRDDTYKSSKLADVVWKSFPIWQRRATYNDTACFSMKRQVRTRVFETFYGSYNVVINMCFHGRVKCVVIVAYERAWWLCCNRCAGQFGHGPRDGATERSSAQEEELVAYTLASQTSPGAHTIYGHAPPRKISCSQVFLEFTSSSSLHHLICLGSLLNYIFSTHKKLFMTCTSNLQESLRTLEQPTLLIVAPEDPSGQYKAEPQPIETQSKGCQSASPVDSLHPPCCTVAGRSDRLVLEVYLPLNMHPLSLPDAQASALPLHLAWKLRRLLFSREDNIRTPLYAVNPKEWYKMARTEDPDQYMRPLPHQIVSTFRQEQHFLLGIANLWFQDHQTSSLPWAQHSTPAATPSPLQVWSPVPVNSSSYCGWVSSHRGPPPAKVNWLCAIQYPGPPNPRPCQLVISSVSLTDASKALSNRDVAVNQPMSRVQSFRDAQYRATVLDNIKEYCPENPGIRHSISSTQGNKGVQLPEFARMQHEDPVTFTIKCEKCFRDNEVPLSNGLGGPRNNSKERPSDDRRNMENLSLIGGSCIPASLRNFLAKIGRISGACKREQDYREQAALECNKMVKGGKEAKQQVRWVHPHTPLFVPPTATASPGLPQYRFCPKQHFNRDCSAELAGWRAMNEESQPPTTTTLQGKQMTGPASCYELTYSPPTKELTWHPMRRKCRWPSLTVSLGGREDKTGRQHEPDNRPHRKFIMDCGQCCVQIERKKCLTIHWKQSSEVITQHTAPPRRGEEPVQLQQLQTKNEVTHHKVTRGQMHPCLGRAQDHEAKASEPETQEQEEREDNPQLLKPLPSLHRGVMSVRTLHSTPIDFTRKMATRHGLMTPLGPSCHGVAPWTGSGNPDYANPGGCGHPLGPDAGWCQDPSTSPSVQEDMPSCANEAGVQRVPSTDSNSDHIHPEQHGRPPGGRGNKDSLPLTATIALPILEERAPDLTTARDEKPGPSSRPTRDMPSHACHSTSQPGRYQESLCCEELRKSVLVLLVGSWGRCGGIAVLWMELCGVGPLVDSQCLLGVVCSTEGQVDQIVLPPRQPFPSRQSRKLDEIPDSLNERSRVGVIAIWQQFVADVAVTLNTWMVERTEEVMRDDVCWALWQPLTSPGVAGVGRRSRTALHCGGVQGCWRQLKHFKNPYLECCLAQSDDISCPHTLVEAMTFCWADHFPPVARGSNLAGFLNGSGKWEIVSSSRRGVHMTTSCRNANPARSRQISQGYVTPPTRPGVHLSMSQIYGCARLRSGVIVSKLLVLQLPPVDAATTFQRFQRLLVFTYYEKPSSAEDIDQLLNTSVGDPPGSTTTTTCWSKTYLIEHRLQKGQARDQADFTMNLVQDARLPSGACPSPHAPHLSTWQEDCLRPTTPGVNTSCSHCLESGNAPSAIVGIHANQEFVNCLPLPRGIECVILLCHSTSDTGLRKRLGSCQSVTTRLLWRAAPAATAVVTGTVHFVTAAWRWENMLIDADVSGAKAHDSAHNTCAAMVGPYDAYLWTVCRGELARRASNFRPFRPKLFMVPQDWAVIEGFTVLVSRCVQPTSSLRVSRPQKGKPNRSTNGETGFSCLSFVFHSNPTRTDSWYHSVVQPLVTGTDTRLGRTNPHFSSWECTQWNRWHLVEHYSRSTTAEARKAIETTRPSHNVTNASPKSSTLNSGKSMMPQRASVPVRHIARSTEPDFVSSRKPTRPTRVTIATDSVWTEVRWRRLPRGEAALVERLLLSLLRWSPPGWGLRRMVRPYGCPGTSMYQGGLGRRREHPGDVLAALLGLNLGDDRGRGNGQYLNVDD
ncbi:hypothetical protein PR048_032922 [Dryococelus australis]|uniref:Uncharacterized protein n=1 Tax=Dryococelus australis TaxID=614101 RepID=A0ABQ9G3M1_9NEOP|nr:hypothetical protein PR048_032922 [Dryococelus australis]